MAAQAEDIKRLKERLEGHPGPVLSVYLSVNARYPENQGQAYKVRLRDALEEMDVPEELAERVRGAVEDQVHSGARTVVFFAADLAVLFFFTADLRSADIFVRVLAALLFVVAGPFFAALLRAGFFVSASSASASSAAVLRAVFRARFGAASVSRSAIGYSV